MFKQLNCKRFDNPASTFAPGPAPQLQWIAIEFLVVDTDYQREISRRGAINVMQIAEHFDWSKFAPVIVAPVEGGRYAIVDGRHRDTRRDVRRHSLRASDYHSRHVDPMARVLGKPPGALDRRGSRLLRARVHARSPAAPRSRRRSPRLWRAVWAWPSPPSALSQR
jgi:hypothetical protein